MVLRAAESGKGGLSATTRRDPRIPDDASTSGEYSKWLLDEDADEDEDEEE